MQIAKYVKIHNQKLKGVKPIYLIILICNYVYYK